MKCDQSLARRPNTMVAPCCVVLGLVMCLSHAGTVQVTLGDCTGSAWSGPAGGAGSTWNVWHPLPRPVLDTNGGVSAVWFTADGDGPFGDWWCDLQLLGGGRVAPQGSALPVAIGGLDVAKTYDLYLTSAWGTKGGHTLFSTSNPADDPSPVTVDNRASRNGTTWVQGQNFALFRNIRPDAAGKLNLTYGGIASYGILNGFQLVETGLAGVAYETWAAAPDRGFTAGENDGPMDDPDGDGIPNLLEYALGGDPLVAAVQILPTLTLSGGLWRFEYDRSDLSRPPACQQLIEYGTDLEHWTAIPVPAVSDASVTVTTSGLFSDHIRAVIPVAGPRLYARLKIIR